MIDTPARRAWVRHVKQHAVDRVFNLVALYGENPDAFKEAFEMRQPPDRLSYLDAAHLLFGQCCMIVDKNWKWTVNITINGEKKDYEVILEEEL